MNDLIRDVFGDKWELSLHTDYPATAENEFPASVDGKPTGYARQVLDWQLEQVEDVTFNGCAGYVSILGVSEVDGRQLFQALNVGTVLEEGDALAFNPKVTFPGVNRLHEEVHKCPHCGGLI